MDTLLCGVKGIAKVENYFQEMYRMLKIGGRFVVITYAPPPLRIDYFKRKKWKWSIKHAVIRKLKKEKKQLF